jgi:hypothetical protein
MYASRRYRSLAVIPRDFVPQQSLRDGHFPSASELAGFSTASKWLKIEKHPAADISHGLFSVL